MGCAVRRLRNYRFNSLPSKSNLVGVIYDSIEGSLALLVKVVFLSVLIFPLEGMFLWPSFSQIGGSLGLVLMLLVLAGETVGLLLYAAK